MPSYSREVQIPGKTAQELYDKIASQIDLFIDKIPIGKFDLDRDPAGRTVSIKSSMVSATLICLEGKLKLDAKLSLLALPFKGKIDEKIDQWVAKNFATKA